MTFRFGLQV